MATSSTHSSADSLALKAVALSKQVTSPEGPLTILDGVSFDIERGCSLAVCGPSGAGKSTLLALLAGLDGATSGEIWLDGTELGSLDEDGRAALRAHRVGFVFQSFHLVPSLTALENVMLPLELDESDEPKSRALEILDSVGLSARKGHYPNQLSGGEKQRVAIARAFAGHPTVLFADEPTGNLDSRTSADIVELFHELHALGTTIVIITHDAELALTLPRSVTILDGHLQSDERRPQVPQPPQPPVKLGSES